MKKAESLIVGKIIKAIKHRYPDAYVRKLSDRFTRGLPDIICVIRGVFICIEVKTAVGKAAKIQEQEMDEIRRGGGWPILARSAEDALNYIWEIVIA
jgi:Holliday junction resolvase